MRKPSIHISEQHLESLIHEYALKFNQAISGKSLAEYILKNGKKYSLRHRSLLANPKSEKRFNNIKSSPKLMGYHFSKLLHFWRIKNHHRGIKMITDNDGSQWNFILQATGLALQFCRDYQIKNIKEGFTTYISLGFSMMKPFGINKYKTYDQKIRDWYECQLMIEKDPNPEHTQLIYDLYEQKIFEKTGQKLDYRSKPGEFRFFVEASGIAKEIGIHPKHYLIAQFEQLDFTNGYPTPNQLSTFKAKERALRWVTENGIRVKQKERKRTKAQEEWIRKYANPDQQ